MYNCNLIKSRAQKIQESQLPKAPTSTLTHSSSDNTSKAEFINPSRPRISPPSETFSVPANPLLPPAYSNILDYDSLQYMNGFLRTQIGSHVEVELLIGTTNLVQKYGILKGVGLNYILLRDPIEETDLACDFYTIKFIKVLSPLNETTDSDGSTGTFL